MKEQLNAQIKELQRRLRDVTENRDQLARANQSLSVQAQNAQIELQRSREMWGENFRQEANFYRALAERAENRCKALAIAPHV